MKEYLRLFEGNHEWAAKIRSTDPEYFTKLAVSQSPQFLFIGCCDSRVPTEVLMAARPGEIFTHRNIANQAHPTDISMLSALEYAVDVLDVKHVMVCGHYNCGGVKAAMNPPGHMLVDNWLQGVRELYARHEDELEALPDQNAKFSRLVELNVVEQVFQLSRTPVVQSGWKKGKRPILHGLVYDVNDGLLKELVSGVDGEDRAQELRRMVTDTYRAVTVQTAAR
ncbi:MAG TPA: carbonic anhydrase [Gemmatimonas sp.]|nr:carbonic anhydrase [Gemmatimonas sp.]